MEQLELLRSRGWGGRRAGAGRKANRDGAHGRRNVPHRARPAHAERHPVLVTLRCALRSLRSQFVYPTLRGALARANGRAPEQFRVVHYSVQANHLHLLVEARDRRALSGGLRSLSIAVARRLNKLLRRKGVVFADRWHGRALATPRAVRHALVYVIANFRKHDPGATALVDVFSSGAYFKGFRELGGQLPWSHPRAGRLRALAPPEAIPVVEARTWLLAVGWRRWGLVGLREKPRAVENIVGARRAEGARANPITSG